MINFNRFQAPWKTPNLDAGGNPIFAFDWYVRSSDSIEFAELAELTNSIAQECASKEDAAMWNFTMPKANAERVLKGTELLIKRNAKDSFAGVSLLALDYESLDYTIDDFVRDYGDHEFVIHTSFSSYSKRKKGAECFRVLLRVKDDLIPWSLLEKPTYDVPSIQLALIDTFKHIDPTSFEPQRGFYIPSMPIGGRAKFRHLYNAGKPFDWTALPQTVLTRPSRVARPTSATVGAPFKLWTLDLERYFRENGLVRQEGSNTMEVECPNAAQHSSGDLARLINYDGRWNFRCFHGHCGSTTWVRNFLFERDGSALAPYCSTGNELSEAEDADDDTPLVLPWAPRKQKANIKKRSTGLVMAEHSAVIELNERYLPEELALMIPARGVAIIKSPKGTGKTELLKRVTAECEKQGSSVMLLGHRVFLLQNLAIRTNLDYYRDLDHGDITSSIAICLNSLPSRLDTRDAPYHTVIIDESEQVFQALISKTVHRNLSEIFQKLIWLFRNAKRIICLDADITTSLTMSLIQDLRGDQPEDECIAVINNYRIGQGQVTKRYADKHHMIADALVDIENGEKVFIATNNRRQATTLHTIAEALGKKSLLVTAETNESDDVLDFIQDPTNVSKLYDVVVSSPTLSTGVSIEGDHFTRVYGLFGINPGTYQDADQALSRVRHCADVRVWMQANKPTDQEMVKSVVDIYYDVIEREKITRKRLPGEAAEMTKGELLWARIYATIDHLVKSWSCFKPQQFDKLRAELGFTIKHVAPVLSLIEVAKEMMNQFKRDDANHALEVFEADNIDRVLAQTLSMKNQKTHDEVLQLERFNIKRLLEDKFSYEEVKKAVDQELLRSIHMLKTLVSSSEEQRIDWDKNDRAENKDTFTKSGHRVLRKDLIDDLCLAANLDVKDLLDAAATEEEIEITQEQMLAVATMYEAKRREFNFFFESRIKDPTNEKNTKKVWDATFGKLSLSLKKRRLGPANERSARYFIDWEKKSQVLEVFSNLA